MRLLRVPAVVPFGAAGVVLVALFFSLVDLGGTVRGTLHPATAFATAWWAGPLAAYAALVRTRAVALAGGALLVALVGWALVALFNDTSSTAGVGVFVFPLLLYPAALSVAAVDGLVADRRAGRARRLLFARRIAAAALSLPVAAAGLLTLVELFIVVDPPGAGEGIARPLASVAVGAALTAGGVLLMRRLWREGRRRR